MSVFKQCSSMKMNLVSTKVIVSVGSSINPKMDE